MRLPSVTETVLLLCIQYCEKVSLGSSRRGATKKLLLKVEGQVKYCGLVAAISQVREPWLSHAWLTFRKKKIATVYIGLQNEGKDWCSKAYYLLLLGTLGLATIISKFVCSIIIKVENKVHSRAEPFLIMMIKFAHYFAKAAKVLLPLYFPFSCLELSSSLPFLVSDVTIESLQIMHTTERMF